MSNNAGKPVSGWTDRELFISLLSVVEATNAKLNYEDATYPPGRNACGFRQKMTALKRELKSEITGGAVDASPKKKAGDAVSKNKTGRKRKAASVDGNEETPTKRAKGKKSKAAVEEEEVEESDSPRPVKEEAEEFDSFV